MYKLSYLNRFGALLDVKFFDTVEDAVDDYANTGDEMLDRENLGMGEDDQFDEIYERISKEVEETGRCIISDNVEISKL